MAVVTRLLWRHLLSKCRCRVSLTSLCVMQFSSCNGRLSPYIIQTILGAVSVVGTLPALYFIETWGRRKVCLLPLDGSEQKLTVFPVPAPWRICASCLRINCPCTLFVSKQCWIDASDRLLLSGILPLRLLEHQLQHSLLAIELGATSSLLLQYFKCSSSARLGDLLRGCTWENLSLFECAPSQLLLAARQVRLLLFHYLDSLLMLVQDWFWNFMLSFFSPRIVDR
jgi:hypothetical protein